jgi:hypothetical protein
MRKDEKTIRRKEKGIKGRQNKTTLKRRQACSKE